MVDVINFYMDDSGTRRPDHEPGKRAAHGYDWFALGGILLKSSDEAQARELYAEFCEDWDIDYPIHSVEVRGTTKGFAWLKDLTQAEREEFYEDLYQLLRAIPAIGLACVIDRPGYNARYREKYGRQSWALCKTAFNVAVERAAKFARSQKCRLRVSPERCNKPEDTMLRGYFECLKSDGHPFAVESSGKYSPLTKVEFQETLYEFRPKYKSSPMAQLADLYLWPICMGGYHASNRPYRRLLTDQKLIECFTAEKEWPVLATKYSCFEKVERKS